MCIYTTSIHSVYLVSDLEGSDNGDPTTFSTTTAAAQRHRSDADTSRHEIPDESMRHMPWGKDGPNVQEGIGCVEESCPQDLAEMFNSQGPRIFC
jgi:hypothetical protein